MTTSVSPVITRCLALPVEVSYTKTEISTRPADAIRADAERLASFPDHPDAQAARHHLELLEHPHALQCRLVYASRDQMYHEVTQIDGSQFVVAAIGSKRWMMMVPPGGDGATVTLIEAGKPAPIVFDVSRLFHMQEATADLLFRFGVPEDAEALVVPEIDADGRELRVHRCDRNGFEYRTMIRRSNPNGGVSSVVTEVRTVDDGVVHERMLFNDYRTVTGIPGQIPRSVRIEFPLGERELIYEFASIQGTAEELVEAYCTVPSLTELERSGGRLYDATSPEMLGSQLASGVGRVTWKKEGSEHSYVYGDSVGEKVQFASGPLPEGSGRSGTRTVGRWIALGIVATAVTGAIVFRRRHVA